MNNAFWTALYSRLQGGTALTSLLAGTTAIYHYQAPDGAALPYVVFNLQGGGDENLSAHRIKDDVIQVRAFTGESMKAAWAIDAQADTLMHLSPLTVTGYANLWLARDGDIETLETDTSGKHVYSAGGLYRVVLEKS